MQDNVHDLQSPQQEQAGSFGTPPFSVDLSRVGEVTNEEGRFAREVDTVNTMSTEINQSRRALSQNPEQLQVAIKGLEQMIEEMKEAA